jgi:hypothetical protein
MHTYDQSPAPIFWGHYHSNHAKPPRGAPTRPYPADRRSTPIVFHYLRESHRSHLGAIASHATDCSFRLAAADPSGVDSHVAPGTAMMRRAAARAHETGLTENTRVPWDAPQGTLVPCVTTPN